MRIIKFRGKTKGGAWVYGDLVHSSYDGTRKIEVSIKEKGAYPVEIIPETVGQLWEVSGIKFFGGDLFIAVCAISGSKDKKERICVVQDNKDGFSVAVWYKKEWWAYSCMDFTTAKIIGNIHDNPELIK